MNCVLRKLLERNNLVEYEEGRNETLELSEKDRAIFGNSFVVVPILSQGEFLGMVHLCASDNLERFTARDIRLIKVFAIPGSGIWSRQ